MTQQQILQLISAGREIEFYTGAAWKATAAQVKRMDRYECQLCKAKGRYSRGELVHHIKHLKDRPDLAMAINDPDTGERQLITLCKRCHEEQHPESLVRRTVDRNSYKNEERWE